MNSHLHPTLGLSLTSRISSLFKRIPSYFLFCNRMQILLHRLCAGCWCWCRKGVFLELWGGCQHLRSGWVWGCSWQPGRGLVQSNLRPHPGLLWVCKLPCLALSSCQEWVTGVRGMGSAGGRTNGGSPAKAASRIVNLFMVLLLTSSGPLTKLPSPQGLSFPICTMKELE